MSRYKYFFKVLGILQIVTNKKARYIAIAGFFFIYEVLKCHVQAMRVLP